jgi:hypothetical protein
MDSMSSIREEQGMVHLYFILRAEAGINFADDVMMTGRSWVILIAADAIESKNGLSVLINDDNLSV